MERRKFKSDFQQAFEASAETNNRGLGFVLNLAENCMSVLVSNLIVIQIHSGIPWKLKLQGVLFIACYLSQEYWKTTYVFNTALPQLQL